MNHFFKMHGYIVVFSILGIVAQFVPAARAESVIDISTAHNYLPGYAQYNDVVLENRAQDAYPCASFGFVISSDGVGYLKLLRGPSDCSAPSKYPRNQIPKWLENVSFSKSGKSPSKLNLTEAKKIWGTPVKQGKAVDCYTFEVHGSVDGEKQIYHIDVKFDERAEIHSYRIRGIGVFNPKFVSETGLEN